MATKASDIAKELSASGWKEDFFSNTDDMNELIFSNLDPLDESKDDMYFFGSKDAFESKWACFVVFSLD